MLSYICRPKCQEKRTDADLFHLALCRCARFVRLCITSVFADEQGGLAPNSRYLTPQESHGVKRAFQGI